MRQQLGAVLLVTALALMTACSAPAASDSPANAPATPASGSATGRQQITVTVGNKVRFEPSSIVVKVGQPVELTLRNEGQIPHDFVLAEGPAQLIKVVAAGGQTARATFTLDRPGTYTFICSVPGHQEAGMKGTITAQ